MKIRQSVCEYKWMQIFIRIIVLRVEIVGLVVKKNFFPNYFIMTGRPVYSFTLHHAFISLERTYVQRVINLTNAKCGKLMSATST